MARGTAVTQSEKLKWLIILVVDCVAILLSMSVKWLNNPPLKLSTIKFFRLGKRFYMEI